MSTEYRVVPVELLRKLAYGNGEVSSLKDREFIRDLIAAPVPPAGGAPEVIHQVRTHGSCCWEDVAGESLVACQADKEEYEVRALVEHIYVTRLHAEVEQQKAISKAYIASDGAKDLRIVATERKRDALKADVETLKEYTAELKHQRDHWHRKHGDLQSELTKARELIARAEGVEGVTRYSELRKDMQAFLAHQSAPAAKDDLVHSTQDPKYGIDS